jgi:ribonuclease HII
MGRAKAVITSEAAAGEIAGVAGAATAMPSAPRKKSLRAGRRLWKHDMALMAEYPLLCGVDEAGRGPLAGSVVAACVILDLEKPPIDGLNDSKQLTAEEREDLFEQITEGAVGFGIGESTSEEIDRRNILGATFLAMQRALDAMTASWGGTPSLILVDGKLSIPDIKLPQRCLVKGDGLSACIASASILAKVTRDRAMDALHKLHPEYGFDAHKGYATQVHRDAIARFGLTPFHRRTFCLRDSEQLSMFED